MRRPIIAGNWKLHLAPRAAGDLARALRERLVMSLRAEIVVFPTALSVFAAVDELEGSNVSVGVQWAHGQPKGAHTGCNSAAIAAEALGLHVDGARAGTHGWLLAGHSEVRRDLGESDARVNASVRAGLAAGLRVMLCLGETLQEREAGHLHAVLGRQLTEGLAGLDADALPEIALAYEPVWAIGTGVVATPAQAQEVHAWIRGWLRERFGDAAADAMRVLYGGSVTPANAAELLALPDVDGCLVGGASLQADAFAAIVLAA
jgi:triosephosphate isomerase